MRTAAGHAAKPLAPPLALYARSRALPATVGVLAVAALFTWWAAARPDTFVDPDRRVPLVSLAPVMVSAAIGVSLHAYARELDATAVRPWWTRRLVHLLTLTALAATVLALAVPGHAETFGAAAMVRNTLGATGLTAASAVLCGARTSWLPTTLYFSGVFLSASSPGVRKETVLAWPVQSGPQTGSWAAALALFAGGVAWCAVVGTRPEGPRG
ncbi:hypothetical protein ACFV6E_12570 [Streptomyces sp. NPDC059785]|uniref:hypothetical protein n=1 Tax=unclassified Streptomyces TaxID=2593676 RepID=UPI003666DE75